MLIKSFVALAVTAFSLTQAIHVVDNGKNAMRMHKRSIKALAIDRRTPQDLGSILGDGPPDSYVDSVQLVILRLY